MFYVHTAPVIFEYITINGHYQFVFEENYMITLVASFSKRSPAIFNGSRGIDNYQRSKQSGYRDLFWKFHDSTQSFVLLSYTMHE